jgi:hypothetical protein
VAVELWTTQGGDHVPGFGSTFAEAIYRFLAAHPRG